MQKGKKQKHGFLEMSNKQQTETSNRATSTEVVICIKEAFAGGFPLPSGQKMVQVKQNFVYWIQNE